jgi:hypothetical protein
MYPFMKIFLPGGLPRTQCNFVQAGDHHQLAPQTHAKSF